MKPFVESYGSLSRDQQDQIAEHWHDGMDPGLFIYTLDARGLVASRQLTTEYWNGTAPLPKPVSSSKIDHQLTRVHTKQEFERSTERLLKQIVRRKTPHPDPYIRRLAHFIFRNGG